MNDNREGRFGATLYVPANHLTLGQVRSGSVNGLGSMVICLEDAIRDDQVEDAIDKLRTHLKAHVPANTQPLAYVRPRTPQMLDLVLRMDGVEHIRGFVLPKATADTLPDWMTSLRGEGYSVMPTIETVHAFDIREVARLRDQALTIGIQVDMMRIGGNDILATIGARRSARRTLYEGPLGPVVTGIVGVFAGTGIALSSPVLEHYADANLLIEEIDMDMEHGIFNKTAIHPRQVPIINNALRPTLHEVVEAKAILATDAKAVFGMEGSMCEPKTHAAWASMVLSRSMTLGTRQPDVRSASVV